jgi:8-oxo-dGTP diphosphatase
VTTDVVVLTFLDEEPTVVLIRRGGDPHKGKWALPGGFVEVDEDLVDGARRELLEETGIDTAGRRLTQFGAYGDPDRDPRMRVVSVAYWVFIPEPPALEAGTDAADAGLIPLAEIRDGTVSLAFDHRTILEDALDSARATGLDVGGK